MGEAGLIRDKLKKSESEVRELQNQVCFFSEKKNSIFIILSLH